MAITHPVRTPLGLCVVTLEREGLDLGDRGGFEVRWAGELDGAASEIDLEAYREVVKAHLSRVYRERYGQEPRNVSLNLASHQLIDDLIGWTKLNFRSERPLPDA